MLCHLLKSSRKDSFDRFSVSLSATHANIKAAYKRLDHMSLNNSVRSMLLTVDVTCSTPQPIKIDMVALFLCFFENLEQTFIHCQIFARWTLLKKISFGCNCSLLKNLILVLQPFRNHWLVYFKHFSYRILRLISVQEFLQDFNFKWNGVRLSPTGSTLFGWLWVDCFDNFIDNRCQNLLDIFFNEGRCFRGWHWRSGRRNRLHFDVREISILFFTF